MLIFLLFLSTLLSGAIFGFFYAWVCSTMWGLDAAAPSIAVSAMQAMNASVRNAVFAPAFFGTGPALMLTAATLWRKNAQPAALCAIAAAALYIFGAFTPTFLINVPMNEALALIPAPSSETEAQNIWAAYSPRWQFWNKARTIASAGTLLLTACALLSYGRAKA